MKKTHNNKKTHDKRITQHETWKSWKLETWKSRKTGKPEIIIPKNDRKKQNQNRTQTNKNW